MAKGSREYLTHTLFSAKNSAKSAALSLTLTLILIFENTVEK